MEVLGVGPLELFFILIIALIFLGPRDMVKAGRTLGKYMRKIVMSPTWRMVQQTSHEIRNLPNRMIREAGMEDDIKDLNQLGKDVENQISSLRNPFSAAASEANLEIRKAAADVKTSTQPAAPAPPADPPVLSGMAAWTTPPSDPETGIEGMEGPEPNPEIENQAEQEPGAGEINPDTGSASTTNPPSQEP
jgi:Sec-independent protein translocase protein TatA